MIAHPFDQGQAWEIGRALDRASEIVRESSDPRNVRHCQVWEIGQESEIVPQRYPVVRGRVIGQAWEIAPVSCPETDLASVIVPASYRVSVIGLATGLE